MWIILLDKSPSMFNPFSNQPSEASSGRVRRTAVCSRWEAAREAVIREVASLADDEEVVIFAFDSQASLVFNGRAAEGERLNTALDGVVAGNGTDIAAALHT